MRAHELVLCGRLGIRNVREMTHSNSTARPKLAIAVTSHRSVSFFEGQLGFLVSNGWSVEVLSSPGPYMHRAESEGANTQPIAMERDIAPLKDIVALFRFWKYFRRARPDLVVAGTPKAGLLGTGAARIAGVRNVIYAVHGLRLETASGWKRRILWCTEWMACHAAHRVFCVSPSLRQRMISLGLVTAKRSKVVGPGTVNGIDLDKWRSTPDRINVGRATRARLGIPSHSSVIGFVGRLVRDKGVVELYEAFTLLGPCHSELRLLLVGTFEAGDPIPAPVRDRIENDPNVIIAGYAENVAPYYWAMDVLALPTYREGFPGAPLEAQAASVPVVCTNATGAVDALLDGITGLIVPVGDIGALTSALDRLLTDPELRTQMGRAGCEWVKQNYPQKKVWSSLLAEYRSLIRESRDQAYRTAE